MIDSGYPRQTENHLQKHLKFVILEQNIFINVQGCHQSVLMFLLFQETNIFVIGLYWDSIETTRLFIDQQEEMEKERKRKEEEEKRLKEEEIEKKQLS